MTDTRWEELAREIQQIFEASFTEDTVAAIADLILKKEREVLDKRDEEWHLRCKRRIAVEKLAAAGDAIRAFKERGEQGYDDYADELERELEGRKPR